MKYALLIYRDEALREDPGTPGFDEMMQGYYKFTEDITTEGINLGGEALHNVDMATVVRVRGGDQAVTDGPFAETKEQLGGFYLVDVEDLDAAISVAARIPAVKNGSIEIRPLVNFG